jgi:hypothetical protein
MAGVPDDDRRRKLLVAALGFAQIRSELPAVCAVKTWLGSWNGIGLIAAGMARQDFDLQLIRFDGRGWRCTFYVTGIEHSPVASTGTAFEPAPWTAVQRAAWAVMAR